MPVERSLDVPPARRYWPRAGVGTRHAAGLASAPAPAPRTTLAARWVPSLLPSALSLTRLVAVAALAGRRCASQPALPNGAATATDVRDLPLVEVPAHGGPAAGTGTVAVLVTGDGGWADLDKAVSASLAAHGVGVVALDARAYLMRRRSPEEAAADVARVARAYLARWVGEGGRLVLVGYSRGADLMPFVATRLPADLRARVRLVAMLGLARTANFQFHWRDVVTDTRRPDDRPTGPELEKLRGMRLLCVYGTDEKDSGCRDADSTLVARVARPGGHHFDRNYPALAGLILGAMGP
jgi:type IV secretory pathway VirJ component